jgi:hypothetical protein
MVVGVADALCLHSIFYHHFFPLHKSIYAKETFANPSYVHLQHAFA